MGLCYIYCSPGEFYFRKTIVGKIFNKETGEILVDGRTAAIAQLNNASNRTVAGFDSKIFYVGKNENFILNLYILKGKVLQSWQI